MMHFGVRACFFVCSCTGASSGLWEYEFPVFIRHGPHLPVISGAFLSPPLPSRLDAPLKQLGGLQLPRSSQSLDPSSSSHCVSLGSPSVISAARSSPLLIASSAASSLPRDTSAGLYLRRRSLHLCKFKVGPCFRHPRLCFTSWKCGTRSLRPVSAFSPLLLTPASAPGGSANLTSLQAAGWGPLF